MSTARAAILSRVRAAQRTAFLPGTRITEQEAAVPPAIDALRRFEEELTALGVEVVHAETAEAIREIVRERTAARRVLSWNEHALPYDVFSVLVNPKLGSSPREEQAIAEIGVTGCDAAVAETGSLVLLSGPGHARTVSLLPPVHLSIVSRSQIVPTLGDAFRRLEERMRGAACCTVITGPSRTADIELTLTLGIHGPGRVIVVIGP